MHRSANGASGEERGPRVPDATVNGASARPDGPPPADRLVARTEVLLAPANVWRVGLVVLAVVALGLLLRFFIQDGGSVIFTVLMSWFAALAMAPVVRRLAPRVGRALATIIVMLVFIALVAIFAVAFGALLVSQLTELIARIPDLIDSALEWSNRTFSTTLTRDSVLSSISGDGDSKVDFGSLASKFGPSLFGILTSAVGTVFGLFTFALFTFYFSADMPRLERWVTQLFPTRSQGVVANVWKLAAEKTGNYVGARVVLALVSGVCSGIVFAVIGLPYWLPLAMWTGIVAQFVPTIGTAISIVLPALVGLLSPNPWLGVVVIVWGLVYQQVENLTIEPKISARAVNVNPAVSFGAVLLGTALFGIAGAFLAVPVVAMLLALLDIYAKRYELASEQESADDLDSLDPRPDTTGDVTA